eukprot:GEZU01000181.1.p2 GENE.GEZU01000181.1~~GEZU01000181.1.p2  ORF type:complete len:161 (-),score=40.88 GEZU01000181.1:812-1294(-)
MRRAMMALFNMDDHPSTEKQNDTHQRSPKTNTGTAKRPSVFFLPMWDISETENHVFIRAELPGMDKKDINIELHNDILTIYGEKKAERTSAEEGDKQQQRYHVVERSFGSFRRSLRLPPNTSPKGIEAAYENGVLIVKIPKPQEVVQKQKVHSVPISSKL